MPPAKDGRHAPDLLSGTAFFLVIRVVCGWGPADPGFWVPGRLTPLLWVDGCWMENNHAAGGLFLTDSVIQVSGTVWRNQNVYNLYYIQSGFENCRRTINNKTMLYKKHFQSLFLTIAKIKLKRKQHVPLYLFVERHIIHSVRFNRSKGASILLGKKWCTYLCRYKTADKIYWILIFLWHLA